MSDERRDDETADEPERLDAPNQQVVRGDESGPAEEGTGGATAPDPAEPDTETEVEVERETTRETTRTNEDDDHEDE